MEKHQTSSVLPSLGKILITFMTNPKRRRRHGKKKQGPHFEEQMQWKVTEDCHVIMICKVTNAKTETTLKWSVDKKPLPNGQFDNQTGSGTLVIKKFTNEDKGLYKAVVKDSRGEDTTELDLINEGFEDIMKEICRISALSASPLKFKGTADGFKIYSDVKYFMESMNPVWHHKDKKLSSTDRLKSGSTMQVWLHITNPTDSDRGLYTLELFDGKDIHKRTLDLSGKVFDDLMAEQEKCKEEEIIEKNRAKVVRGLPDLATIMVDKTLCLTCHISGDPAPEVCWLKNEKKKVIFKDRYKLEVKDTVVTMTIEKICAEDSGRYCITVKNKYGSEVGQVTVSVFKHGEEPEELKDVLDITANLESLMTP
ncbi:unnamed protein product [Staurois parvus]|uniref:Ig-like domain-containing protein n=1 Tax=Staurois parvus TaxID=386267 RepID=A0ABN9C7D4_9NEOB|nr:unnamed protein product [Staurois parvus]